MALVTSDDFYRRMVAAGVMGDDPPRSVSKVVIVAENGQPLRVFVEYLGEEGWLDTPSLMAGVDVHTAPPDRPAGVSYYDLGEGGPKAR